MRVPELREKLFSLIPKDFISEALTWLSASTRDKLFDKHGELKGRTKERIIRAYLQRTQDPQVHALYNQLKQAKEKLFKQNIKLAYALMKRMRVSRDDWDEALGFVLEGLLYAVDNWDGKHAFSTIAWMNMFAKLQDFYIQSVKERKLSLDAEVCEGEEDTFEIFYGQEEKGFREVEILHMIDSLPEREREIIIKVLEGYKISEIARQVSLSREKTLSLYHKALAKLRKQIEGGEEHDTEEGLQLCLSR